MLPQLTAGGMLIGSLVEAKHFINATRSLESAAFVARKTAKYLADRLAYGRDMSLVNGMALVARHALALDELDVPVWVNAPAVELMLEQGRVCGAWLSCDDRRICVRARRGVVMACGGFPHDEQRKRKFYGHVAAGAQHFAVAPTSCTGDGLTLGESAGGEVVEGRPWNCLFMPVSRLAQAAAQPAVFPHIWDRSKPGFIAVTPQGRRFVDEATSYMQFGQAMVQAANGSADARAWLICDTTAIQRYGLGVVRPMLPLRPHIRSGYLRRGSSIKELARTIGVPAAQLVQTVDEYNEDATRGTDRRFGKGTDAFSRFQGDPAVAPNPTMAPLTTAPFYAVEIFCGDFGTFTGLRTNASAQVIDRRSGMPVPGLYAAGNDMATVMGSHSVGGGITIGPAMVFGYIAGCHLATTPRVP
jgi:succinate dehydrogenase/fumarate reductase flavoprotein subunit